MIKLKVDLYKPSGKWAYGDYVNVSGKYNIWDDEFKQEIVHNQSFVTSTAFKNYIVVVSHSEEFENSNETGFYQQLYPVGSF